MLSSISFNVLKCTTVVKFLIHYKNASVRWEKSGEIGEWKVQSTSEGAQYKQGLKHRFLTLSRQLLIMIE